MNTINNKRVRCINLDWLEVYCLEPISTPHDIKYFRSKYIVKEREYGTPQYKQMFTLYKGKVPFMEIRRLPYSIKEEGGIFPKEATHLRMVNESLYELDPVGELLNFLTENNYKLISLTRVDIALDFNRFDQGQDPQEIVRKIMSGEIAKINQSRISSYGVVDYVPRNLVKLIKSLPKDTALQSEDISAHGIDTWSCMQFNSLKWGAPTSPISTKLYNKSMELDRDGHDKFYIRDCWKDAGLDLTIPVWRVEFSIKSHITGYVKLYDNEMIKNDIETYSNRNRLIWMFYTLAQKYFHFKQHVLNRNGVSQRKDRCPDVVLFDTSELSAPFKPFHEKKGTEPTRTDKMIFKKLFDYKNDDSLPPIIRKAAETLRNWQTEEMRIGLPSSYERNYMLDYLQKLNSLDSKYMTNEQMVARHKLVRYYETMLGTGYRDYEPRMMLFYDCDDDEILKDMTKPQQAIAKNRELQIKSILPTID